METLETSQAVTGADECSAEVCGSGGAEVETCRAEDRDSLMFLHLHLCCDEFPFKNLQDKRLKHDESKREAETLRRTRSVRTDGGETV